MNEDIRWVKLTRQEIADFIKNSGVIISRNIVKKLLKKHKFVKRKMLKKIPCGEFADRNKQFEIIQVKLDNFKQSSNPVISMDTKSKELLGRIFRQGKVYGTRAIEAHDHSNDSLITGTLIPHGIYDLKLNIAHINIGTTHETAGFLCDSLKQWWLKQGKINYPDADEILIFCDAGGANSWRIHVFKIELQKLCDEIQMKITICHYPPYASKWNPIEHRVFPHITRAMEGVMLETHEQAKKLIEKASTKTGLRVTSNIIDKTYKIGLVTAKKLLEKINIKYDDVIPGLNYSINPLGI
jgi:hypothetical protein